MAFMAGQTAGHLIFNRLFLLKLTIVLFQSSGDLTEDPGVTGNHDDQRQQEQAAKREHVVGRFMPVGDKAPPCCALSKVLGMDDGYIVKKEHLRREKVIFRKGFLVI